MTESARQVDTTQTTKFKPTPRYPLDVRDLRALFTNHVVIAATDSEVYLDLCLVEPQQLLALGADAGERALPATVMQRVVMTRPYALKIAKQILEMVEAAGQGERDGGE